MKGIIKKADLVLAAFLLLFCGLTALFALKSGSGGAQVYITVDGQDYGRWPLAEEKTIEIDTDRGHNQVTIKDGKAFMSEADCPDGYCMGQHSASGGIDRTDQTIVCLPHRVVVMVEDEDGQVTERGDLLAPDAVSGAPAAGDPVQTESDDTSELTEDIENESGGDSNDQ